MATVHTKILGSGHHVHLKKEDLEVLFGKGAELTMKRPLAEDPKDGFLCNEKVTLVCPKGQMSVSILGPLRPYTQIEISYTDATALGVSPRMSNSGKLTGTSACKLIGPAGELNLTEGLMIVRRHVHMTDEDMATLGCNQGDMVRVHVSGPRALTFEQVIVCPQNPGLATLMHIDYDEMNAAAINNIAPAMGIVEFCHDPQID